MKVQNGHWFDLHHNKAKVTVSTLVNGLANEHCFSRNIETYICGLSTFYF